MNMRSSKINVSGEKVSIGIDVHLRQYAVTCLVKGELCRRVSMPASPRGLISFIHNHFGECSEVSSVYEAGFSGFALHRELIANGIKNIVVNPASIEVSPKDRVKTDKRDSLRLAKQLESGTLKGVRVPSEAEEARRVLPRTREQLVVDCTRIISRIRMRFYYFGIELERVLYPSRVRAFLENHPGLPIELRKSIEFQVTIWESIRAEKRELEKQLRLQASEDPLERIYRSIPGFGNVTSRVLSTELGDMSQFSNERKLFSFAGLTPTEHSSGERERRGHITRQGSSRLRRVLVEASWRTIACAPEWREIYDRLKARIGGNRAIVAVARKLLGVARTLLRKNMLYEQTFIQRELPADKAA